jgi:16S rRNA (uracil1498-N3)-methyltransferase
MAVHTIFFPDLPAAPGGVVTISGEEAHHALRVKRLSAGDMIRLCNGSGLVAEARFVDSRKVRAEWTIDLDLMSIREVPAPRPCLRVLASAPKGDRLAGMIDGLSQVGAASWIPLLSARTVVEPREGKLERLERIALESMKQCGRAWVMGIGEAVDFSDAVRAPATVIADASGGSYQRTGSPEATLLIGPEGGWTSEELEAARKAGVQVARFGPHIMRTEVAAVVSAAMVMQAES